MKLAKLLAVATLVGAALAAVPALAQAADAKKGQQLFITYGCYGCHGYNGQGANTGVRLAPNPMALDAMTAYIRNASSTLMPPYSAANLPDAEIADMHAWLTSQPKAADWKTIPLLKE